MNGSDHCPECFCEQFEERCDWDEGQPWQARSEGSKFSQAMRESALDRQRAARLQSV
jgi:hypothetical protein